MGGYFEDMQKGNVHHYEPGKFSFDDMLDIIRKQDAMKPQQKPFRFVGSRYMVAVFSGDKAVMAEEEKLMRIRQIGLYRKYLQQFGSGMAKVIAHLDRKHRKTYTDFQWRINVWDLIYGGVDSRDELAVVGLYVKMSPDHTFSIEVNAGYEYGGTWQKKVLSSGISYKSLHNQVNYFR